MNKITNKIIQEIVLFFKSDYDILFNHFKFYRAI